MAIADISLYPAPEVPWPWRIAWRHFATPLAQRDTTQIGESIFYGSCGPYGMELGLWRRQDDWAYDLHVNDRWSDGAPLFDRRFNDPAQALAALDHWLKKLTDQCLADGSAIAAITRSDSPADPSRLVCRFTPPSGHTVVNPCPKFVRSLLWWQSGAYWASGSGDASVTFKADDGRTVSELIFLLREPHGVFLQLQSPNAPTVLAVSADSGVDGTNDITVQLCGAPLTLPQRVFVDRNTAAEIVSTFIEGGSGDRPPYAHWMEA